MSHYVHYLLLTRFILLLHQSLTCFISHMIILTHRSATELATKYLLFTPTKIMHYHKSVCENNPEKY